jgi:LPS-assembly lipoprotein
MRKSWLMLVCVAVLLSACGFQLRGHQNYPFKHLMITGAPPAMQGRLKRYIEGGSDTVVVDTLTDADAVLRITENPRNQSTLTLDEYGNVVEYQLNYSVNYMVTTKEGALLLAPSVISLNRAMTYNSQYANAKEQESEILFSDMQSDAVDQILRRMGVIHTLTPATPDDVVKGIAPRAPLPPPPL